MIYYIKSIFLKYKSIIVVFIKDSFHYEGKIGNTTYSEHTTVCESTKTEFGIVRDTKTGFVMNSFFTDYIEVGGRLNDYSKDKK